MIAACFLFAVFVFTAPVRVHAASEYTVSGVWVFNDQLSLPSDRIPQSVNFFAKSGLTGISITPQASNVYASWIDPDSGATCSGAIYSSGIWQNTDFQTIDFGETEQVVSEEFYAWLNANATFQAPPPDPGPLVEAVTDLQDQKILEQVLVPILAILPIGLVCLVGYKGLRKALDLLRGILHQA